MSKLKPKESKPITFDDIQFSNEATPEERQKALELVGISKLKPLHEQDSFIPDVNNDAMLGDSGGKKVTVAERIGTLFRQQKFSPITRLLRLVKIEEAKIEAYNRALSMGLEPKLLDCLPKPDVKLYASLLLQMVKYEVPEYKSIEVSGGLENTMKIQVINTQPQQKVVRIDAGAPQKLKQMFGATDKVLEVITEEIKSEIADY